MNAKGVSVPADVQRKKKTIGAIAVAFGVTFLVLLFFRVLGIIDFLILDLIVGLVANYLFRRLDRQANS